MGFHSRHKERDKSLPEVRKALLEKIVHSLKSNSDVLAIFMGGSLAKGNMDLFSDIDLRIVVEAEKFNEYVNRKQQTPRDWGEILFFEDMNPLAPFTVVHFDNFIKVDVFFYSTERLKPSIWYKEIKILHDPPGIIARLIHESKQITYQVTQDEVNRWRGKVFSYIHEVYRRVHRSEFYYALTMINNLRSFIVNGWNMEVDRHSNDAWDWSKIEGERSELESWQLSLLGTWSCGRDEREIMKTLMSMIPEIERLHEVLCKKTGLPIDNEKVRKVIEFVL
jgi:predicted nucleotidyltransferase